MKPKIIQIALHEGAEEFDATLYALLDNGRVAVRYEFWKSKIGTWCLVEEIPDSLFNTSTTYSGPVEVRLEPKTES